jgi:hypothetical protein
MDPKTKELVENCERRIVHGDGGADELDTKSLCTAVCEQDKRARHAEQERDAFDKRIAELETQLKERDNAAKAWDALAVARLKTINEQAERILRIDESNADLSRKLGGLSAMLAAYGLPSEPKSLAGAIERERTANMERIAELEKERDGLNRETEAKAEMITNLVAKLETVTSSGEAVPTNENFVRVAMTDHCAPSSMDDRYIKEWSRRFKPALDIIRARVAFKVNELETKIAEAVDLAGEAIPYVSEYFRKKYDMGARFAKLLPSQSADESDKNHDVGGAK